ncbi:hypothetical protein Tco_1568671 [Tanacetum coccineum]
MNIISWQLVRRSSHNAWTRKDLNNGDHVFFVHQIGQDCDDCQASRKDRPVSYHQMFGHSECSSTGRFNDIVLRDSKSANPISTHCGCSTIVQIIISSTKKPQRSIEHLFHTTNDLPRTQRQRGRQTNFTPQLSLVSEKTVILNKLRGTRNAKEFGILDKEFQKLYKPT